jgi:hypothetical protein
VIFQVEIERGDENLIPLPFVYYLAGEPILTLKQRISPTVTEKQYASDSLTNSRILSS